MKKKIFLLAVISITAFLFFYNNRKVEAEIEEVRGVFISYLEYQEYFKGKNELEIEKEIKKMINNVEKYNINTIYLQVRMFSDSIYKSKIFPFTDTIADYQGQKLDIDILDLFIKYAKAKNIKLYAWVNPYRISNTTNTDRLSKDNPAYIYLNTNHVHIIEDKGIYYNPASNLVKNLVIAGIVEIVSNYDVDGILFDDYFYPDDTIDLENYKEVENTISIKDYRLAQVNELISTIYKTIKSINSDIEFGISPDGNIVNNYELYYADVKKWIKEDGYVDFIMPQLYYGFDHGVTPFIKTINEWNSLIENNSKLLIALALYKSGNIDKYAKTGENEWLDNSNIISREIEYARSISNYNGYSLFRYGYLVEQDNSNLKEEVDNYLKIF